MQVCAQRLGLHHEHMLCAFCRHLRELLGDAKRSEMLFYEHNGILADLSRQRITDETLSVSSSAWAWSRLAADAIALSHKEGLELSHEVHGCTTGKA